ncbi:hypothetical protein SAMN04487976_10843 [Xaviernesmea oryzae]|nr:hypothetical protein SAMN04487976_10843 [Xaviernesmea oryzae]
MINNVWLLAIAGGALVLGAAIAFAIMRQRRLRPDEKRAQDANIDRLYTEPR